ncbi:S8 family serine peptidase [Peribacillus tepidiphilus]|uniref:S8 family serine peptidase n=1 Tax=Peribacillus tepidiphilus TaxID=2652445 RepID=UPI001292B833|nr:S8 family serine peptidase [Peribacillus tepidiphilus]
MKLLTKKIIALGLGFSLLVSPTISATSASASNLTAKLNTDVIKQTFMEEKNESTKPPLFSEDTLVIKYKQPLSSLEHRSAGAVVIQQVSKLKYSIVKVTNKKGLQKALSYYQKNKKVESVTRSANYQTYTALADPKVKEQYHLSLLKMAEAQKLAGKNKVTVAVIDTGIDQKHPDLQGLFLPGYNVLNPMNQGTPDEHGTHVTGIIGARKDNGIGGYGINPKVKVLPIDVFDRSWFTSDFTIAQAILYAVDHGAKVINMSLGSPVPSKILEEAVQTAIDKGVTIVAAAGNEGNASPNYPASYEGVIGVGSINKEKQLSSFSSFGPSVDLVAPGEDIYGPIYHYEKKSSFEAISGTSMASPVVAGVVSLLLSKYPNLKPAQVEYILEHTATDLGSLGFDTKFGHGLINPIAALKFDLKKVPSLVKGNWTQKEIVEYAEDFNLGKTFTKQGFITKPYQQDWYKAYVEKGEYLQLNLLGASQYDYKMMIHFYSDEGVQLTELNDVSAGVEEGKLIQAPFSGMVAIGVKDVNGSYDDSSRKQSYYRLTISKSKELPVDDSTFDAPVRISSFPYMSNNMQFIGEKGDDDFFIFKTNDEQIMKISINGVPGVDSHLSVYNKESLGIPAEEIPAVSPNFEEMGPDFHKNSGGVGEGETAVFPVSANTEYILRISSKRDNFFNENDFWSYISYMNRMNREGQSSLFPYQLKLEGKVFPQDEDMPKGEGGEAPPASDMVKAAETAAQRVFASLEDKEVQIPDMYEDPEQFYQYISNNAVPYEIGQKKTGYIQTLGDEDWYILKPTQTGIYQFNLSVKSDVNPYVEVLSVEEAEDQDGKLVHYLNPIGHNVSYNWFYDQFNNRLFTGLTKGKTYFIHYMPNPYQGLSMDAYSLHGQLIVENPGDRYENNDSLEKIKNLPSPSIQGNFAMPNDVDAFYLEGKTTGIYSLLLENGEIQKGWESKYPKALLSPINGIAIVVEDINKNRKMDEADSERASIIVKGLENGSNKSNYGSFKVEKGKNYIIVILGMIDGQTPLSLVPYQLTVAPTVNKDEDQGSSVKHYTPSKPLSLKKQNAKLWKAQGHFNTGVPYGDEDWYMFEVKDAFNGYITLQGGHELDGVITIYQNGKQVSHADYYPLSQSEVMPIQLRKGKYFIKVKDSLGNATIKPYLLTIEKK